MIITAAAAKKTNGKRQTTKTARKQKTQPRMPLRRAGFSSAISVSSVMASHSLPHLRATGLYLCLSRTKTKPRNQSAERTPP
ncbi:hypothetical protein QTO30_03130 [Yoonia sp. GPGPB17]|uniref:hypothetical protein n=1 Tax=Yoonia sp. GPGPB17 TaxID=3026147 RepID=UPI0030BFE3D6